MAYTAHVAQGGGDAGIVVRDDRGVPAGQLSLPAALQRPEQADEELLRHGWERTAGWTATDQGWDAPVEPRAQAG